MVNGTSVKILHQCTVSLGGAEISADSRAGSFVSGDGSGRVRGCAGLPSLRGLPRPRFGVLGSMMAPPKKSRYHYLNTSSSSIGSSRRIHLTISICDSAGSPLTSRLTTSICDSVVTGSAGTAATAWCVVYDSDSGNRVDYSIPLERCLVALRAQLIESNDVS
jgi:hypothetical protein